MVRWVLGSVLAFIAALVVSGNLVGGIRAMRSGRSFSAVPFVGGILGVLALFVLPVEHRTWLSSAIVLLDYTFPSALLALMFGASRRPRPPG